jgi:putative nucleotidyltransferase with HDIG domain
VLKSSIPGIAFAEVESAFQGCRGQAECEVRLRGETYVSLPMESINFGQGFLLRTLQSIDSANAPVQKILRNVFLITGIGTLLATVILSVLSSRSIVRPIAGVVSHLSQTGETGVLPEFHLKPGPTPIHEIRELTESFNRAARSIRGAQENLLRAYVEFVESLASALDARDRYTAGHSRRVSDLACAIARKMDVTVEEMDEICKGALLHDIGKIGIPDGVLQKPEALTNEEFALIQQHPTVGRRILERVGGFKAYLPVVELHHENWTGSGYPWGLRGDATPLSARIVHLADAYDAMTTDRPYRPALSHEEAMRALQQNAGTQFDPAIVSAFLKVAVNPAELDQPSGGGPGIESAELLKGQQV